MRKIDSVIIHCSATKAGMDFSVADIDRWHRAQGMNGIGYHYVVRLDGTVEKGREVEVAGAHCLGWNGRSIGICYIGGLDGGFLREAWKKRETLPIHGRMSRKNR